MHQPDYRDAATGRFTAPWTLLHALKDYTDMAAHLERHPGVRAVVNFVPVLLEQLDDYCDQFATGAWRDPYLDWLARPDLSDLPGAERSELLAGCFRANQERAIDAFPPYRFLQTLVRLAGAHDGTGERYLSGQLLADLVTWYFLAWTGESVRRTDPRVIGLMTKGAGFTAADRRALLAVAGELVAGIQPRYRVLAARGQIELSTTPWAHPLAPLLVDLRSAHDAEPAAPLPEAREYPGGRSRVLAHLDRAVTDHAARFGAPAVGAWPAEGAVSTEVVRLFAGRGIRWMASGQGVLAHSLRAAGSAAQATGATLYRPYRIDGIAGLDLVFRDDRLSDLIGFEYSKWHGRDAAAHFVAELDAIARTSHAGGRLVCVILDGENAWEHFPYNAWHFFEDLYGLLGAHAGIATTTLADALADKARPRGHLPALAAGSWVYGNLSTWIGSPAKNRAWDLLCAAKRSYDMVIASGRLDPAAATRAERQLMVCEGSDWFWWFGDYNPQPVVEAFDRLYRANLARLYGMLGLVAPDALSQPLSHGGGSPEGGGAMRRAT